MSGSVGLFRDGLLIGLVRRDALHLRVDDGNRALFGDGPCPFRYARKGLPAELGFRRLPNGVPDDAEGMVAWARAALAAAQRAAAERHRKKPRPSPRPA
jgi:DNA transformation protein